MNLGFALQRPVFRKPVDIGELRTPRLYVVLDDNYEVAFWCLVLDCTRSELIDAVATVGKDVAAVRRYFSR